MTTPQHLLSNHDKDLVLKAIREAENNTSGEIRVHIENSCKGDVLDQATYIFSKLKMHQTKLRNGVLFYLAVKNRKFAVIGDAGINAVTGNTFWDAIKETMSRHFAEQKIGEGLAAGIQETGHKLKEHFPCQKDDVNELPDEISYGK